VGVNLNKVRSELVEFSGKIKREYPKEKLMSVKQQVGAEISNTYIAV
jgi:hypothetical protein